jgi:hypothetical protein
MRKSELRLFRRWCSPVQNHPAAGSPSGILTLFILSCSLSLLFSCANVLAPSKKDLKYFTPLKKYAPQSLQRDFDLMRTMMEKFHPSLYWYTPKDSIDQIFDFYRAAIKDSMTEQQFGFRIIAPVTSSIRCGHTSFNYSKKYNKAMRGIRLPSFPLFLKVWGDSMVVTSNLNRKDSLIKRGTVINSIDGLGTKQITDIMFRYLPTDGYAENINYIRISNSFPSYHRNIFGLKKSYSVNFTDSTGQQRVANLPLFDPYADTLQKVKRDSKKVKVKKMSKQERLRNIRSLVIDSSTRSAVMSLNSFDGGNRLPQFFRSSFRKLREENIENLVIDIRSNGGGKVNHYTRLSQYLRKTPFKVADTAYAVTKKFGSYGKYFQSRFVNSLALGLFTARRHDSLYHFTFWEQHVYKPKKHDFYGGDIYVLIGGPTFSASTLFAQTMKGQENVMFIGEETSGGSHGNNGLMIPNITLPNTGVRVRMPLFRLIQYNHPPKNGRGIAPDVLVPPNSKAVVYSTDLKMEKAFEIIRSKKGL